MSHRKSRERLHSVAINPTVPSSPPSTQRQPHFRNLTGPHGENLSSPSLPPPPPHYVLACSSSEFWGGDRGWWWSRSRRRRRRCVDRWRDQQPNGTTTIFWQAWSGLQGPPGLEVLHQRGPTWVPPNLGGPQCVLLQGSLLLVIPRRGEQQSKLRGALCGWD